MELAYMGLFEKVFNWVLDKIFDPIFSWLSDLLSDVFTWLFNKILKPVLLPVLEEFLDLAVEAIMLLLGDLIYLLFSGILKLVDYMETAFDIFIGIKPVAYKVGNDKITGSLLDVLIQQDSIMTVFWALSLAGLAMALLLTIFGTARSSFDLDFENKRPVSRVLTSMMKAFINLFSVPLFVFFMIKLAAVIMQGITTALTGSMATSLGRIVFMIASLDAAKDDMYNVSSSKSRNIALGANEADYPRWEFYKLDGSRDYGDIEVVKDYFYVDKFDYLIGFLAALFLLFIMAVCLITFVQRIFDIILLYIVSPYFVSTMPLDDGERFGRWRNMFIGKCFTGFGSAIGMRMYLLVCPMIMGNALQFSQNSSPELDYMIRLFFLLGGAWAVFKSGPMLTGLISSGAGQSESAVQQTAGGFLMAHTAGSLVNAGKMALTRGMSKGASSKAAGAGKDKAQKFEGSKDKSTLKNTKALSKVSAKTKVLESAKAKTSIAGKTAVQPKTDSAAGKTAVQPKIDITAGKTAVQPKTDSTAGKTAVQPMPEDVSYKTGGGFKLGSFLQNTYDDEGNHKIRVMGIGINRDKSGNTTAVRLPGVKVKRTEFGSPMQLSRLHIPGVVNIKSNLEDGQLKYSDVSVMHGLVNYHHDESGSSLNVTRFFGKETDSSGHTTGLRVAPLRIHNRADGVDFNIGKLKYSNDAEGNTLKFGSHMSFGFSHGEHKINSVNIGSLQYNRTGIVKKQPKETKTGGDKS